MTGIYRLDRHRGRSRRSAPVVGVVAAALLGCGGLLDVENPNNVPGDNILQPDAATSLSNGAQRQVSFGVNAVNLVYSTATDELDWVGSRDGWRELMQGKFSNGYNEFTDAAMPRLAEGRWLADEAIKILEDQQAKNTLLSPTNLARAYVWGAIAYVTIADMFDDWALSNRANASAPVGKAALGGFYDIAIGYLNKGLPLATGELALTIRAMRARANFSRAIWDLVGKRPIASATLVNAASSYVTNAVTEAQAVLAAVPSADWKFRFTYSVGIGENDFSVWIQQRGEMRIGQLYTAVDPTTPKKWLDQTVLLDPIDTSKPAAVVNAVQKEQKIRYAPHTVVSAREMHLILAEAELAQGDLADFEDAINDLRDLDGLTRWDRNAPQVPARDLLLYSRRANLYLQGRRLADHYRFRSPSPDWLIGSQGLEGGWYFPITARECLSNEHIGASKCST